MLQQKPKLGVRALLACGADRPAVVRGRVPRRGRNTAGLQPPASSGQRARDRRTRLDFAASGGRGWAAYSVTTAVAFLIGFVLAGLGFSQHPLFAPIGGLLQRLTIVTGWAWLTALALHLLRSAQVSSGVRQAAKAT